VITKEWTMPAEAVYLSPRSVLTYEKDAEEPWRVLWATDGTLMDTHRSLAQVLWYEFPDGDVPDATIAALLALRGAA
jgi:hypothetical protein